MLKAVLSNLDEVDEGLRSLYKLQEDGTHLLQVEGMSPKNKVDEFRNSNIQLSKEIIKLKDGMSKFKDIDPTKYKEYEQKVLEIQDKNLIDAGQIDEVVAQRTERMRQDYETKTNALQKVASDSVTKHDQVSAKLDDFMLTSELTKVATTAKIKSSAITDAINRGKSIFQHSEGKITPREADGSIMYGNDGTSEMTMTEWAEGLNKTAPHLFEESQGGGAHGGGRGGNKSIESSDLHKMGQNLEKIAKGEVKVNMG